MTHKHKGSYESSPPCKMYTCKKTYTCKKMFTCKKMLTCKKIALARSQKYARALLFSLSFSLSLALSLSRALSLNLSLFRSLSPTLPLLCTILRVNCNYLDFACTQRVAVHCSVLQLLSVALCMKSPYHDTRIHMCAWRYMYMCAHIHATHVVCHVHTALTPHPPLSPPPIHSQAQTQKLTEINRACCV